MTEDTLRQEIDEIKERIQSLEEQVEQKPNSISRSMDLSTFVQNFDPDTHPERIAAIAYYQEAYNEQDMFTTSDVREWYEQARFQKPSNLSDAISGAEDMGWVHRKGKDGRKTVRQLTNKGVNMVKEVVSNES